MSSSRPANYADILAEFDILSQTKPPPTDTSDKLIRPLHRPTVSDLSGVSLHHNVWATLPLSTSSLGLGSSTSANQLNRSFTSAEAGLTGKASRSPKRCVSPNRLTESFGQDSSITRLPGPTLSLKMSILQSALSNPWSDTSCEPDNDLVLPSLTPVAPSAIVTAHESEDDFGEFVDSGSPTQNLNLETPTWPSPPRGAPQPLTVTILTPSVPNHSVTQVGSFNCVPKVDLDQTPDNFSSWKFADGNPQVFEKLTPTDKISGVPPLTVGEHSELITTWKICVSQGRDYLLRVQTLMTGLAHYQSDTPHHVRKVLQMDKVTTFLRGILEVYNMMRRIRHSIDEHRHELPSQPLEQLDTLFVECEALYNSIRPILEGHKLETLQVRK
ncbi:hypothetical protein IWQ61_007173 [Dispira simplex]|nr:hypothetical protein IWQ61_007173 [Dispira simplex]